MNKVARTFVVNINMLTYHLVKMTCQVIMLTFQIMSFKIFVSKCMIHIGQDHILMLKILKTCDYVTSPIYRLHVNIMIWQPINTSLDRGDIKTCGP